MHVHQSMQCAKSHYNTVLIFFPKLNYLDKNLQEILCKFHFLFNIVFLSLVKVCHDRENLGENESCSKSGKRQVIFFSEKSGNSVFLFIVVSFLQAFEVHLLLEKMKGRL